MANISSYIRAIELAARGEEVRDAIINALTAINEQGTGNADTLEGHAASYFATAAQLTGKNPVSKLVEIYPSSWASDGTYSFESIYPSLNYDVMVQPGPDSTVEQLEAIGDAMIVAGSENLNVIRCVGTIPDRNIQLMLLAVKRS